MQQDHYKQILEKLSRERKEEAKRVVYEKLGDLLKPYRKVRSFKSFPDEVDLAEVNSFLGERVCFEEEEFDCILVPGLAFDRQGVRVGRGKGFYDKLLAKYPDVYTIGICYKEQLSLQLLPKEEHDKPVKFVCVV